ncbi:MAG: NAD-dependent epimerase/dehydratase family protein, partial [Candidatus Nitrosocosmicus sp.]|nr:NAD-dependent epimerase/dehydratase family protein [Candidatus Nitrosocosmicus sp.]
DLNDGSIEILKLNVGPVGIRWIAQHFGYLQNRQFQDKMIKGPFRYWLHTHSFFPNEPNNCIMEDRINYLPPFEFPGINIINNKIHDNLYQLFYYRHRILKNDMILWKLVGKNRGKKILITGSTGLIGSALVPFLNTVGDHHVTQMIRPSSTYKNNNPNVVKWDPDKGKIDTNDLEGYDTIIHLSGENTFGRWSDSKKKELVESRLTTTKLLCDSLVKLKNPPSTLICASAIGIYGDRRKDVLTEDTFIGSGFLSSLCQKWEESIEPVKDICASAIGIYGDRRKDVLTEDTFIGSGFLSSLCQKWEESIEPVQDIGIRLINARFGMILTPRGGMLKKLVQPSIFKIGLKMGSENQYISWISIEDVIRNTTESVIVDTDRNEVLNRIQTAFSREIERYGKLQDSDIRPMDYKTRQVWTRVRKHIKNKDHV